jgi:hypothetical protein
MERKGKEAAGERYIFFQNFDISIEHFCHIYIYWFSLYRVIMVRIVEIINVSRKLWFFASFFLQILPDLNFFSSSATGPKQTNWNKLLCGKISNPSNCLFVLKTSFHKLPGTNWHFCDTCLTEPCKSEHKAIVLIDEGLDFHLRELKYANMLDLF